MTNQIDRVKSFLDKLEANGVLQENDYILTAGADGGNDASNQTCSNYAYASCRSNGKCTNYGEMCSMSDNTGPCTNGAPVMTGCVANTVTTTCGGGGVIANNTPSSCPK